MTSTPQMVKGTSLNWLYRPFITEIGGICYDYSNAGSTANAPEIVYFTTGGSCATTEQSGPWTYAGVALTISQPWEGSTEIQDPQVFQDPSGLYVMIYGGNGMFKAGYATTATPAANNWTKLASNPIQAAGDTCDIGPTCGVWLPRITKDADGQYWMFSNYNNTTSMQLYKASGSVAPLTYESNGLPLSSTNPAWVRGVDSAGNYTLGSTYPQPATTPGFWTPKIPYMTYTPGAGLGFFTSTPVPGGGGVLALSMSLRALSDVLVAGYGCADK